MLNTREIWLKSTPSTMGEAKNISAEHDFCLAATEIQTQGRGTQGRIWLCEKGNIFFTAGVHNKWINHTGINTLPLLVGNLLYRTLYPLLQPTHQKYLSLKWPNDLLLNEKKMAGVLIENQGEHFFIGVGINISSAPEVTDKGRPSACLADYVNKGITPQNEDIIRNFYQLLQQSLTNPSSNSEITSEWSKHANWNEKIYLRSDPKTPLDALKINETGQLQIRTLTGQTRWITSEYLY